VETYAQRLAALIAQEKEALGELEARVHSLQNAMQQEAMLSTRVAPQQVQYY
jgi:hypothetical protein